MYTLDDECVTTLRVHASPIRTLVVDDEAIARQLLRDELGGFADIEIAGEAANGNDNS